MSGDLIVPKLPTPGGTVFTSYGYAHRAVLNFLIRFQQARLMYGLVCKAGTVFFRRSWMGVVELGGLVSRTRPLQACCPLDLPLPSGDGFYGTPSLPWGNGFNVNPGDTVHFTFSSVRSPSSHLDAKSHGGAVRDGMDHHSF